MTSRKRIIGGLALALLIVAGAIVTLVVLKNSAQVRLSLPPEAGEMHSYLAFCEVYNPYGSGSVMVKSDNSGHGVVDTSRTNWWASDSMIYEGYNTLTFNPTDYERVMRNPARYDTAWLYGPVDDFDKWASNDWNLAGCNIDVDCQCTGVPNVVSNFLRFYPADSQGNPSDDFGHTPIEIEDVDDNGNPRTMISHVGWVVAEYDFIIQAQKRLLTKGVGGTKIDLAPAETYGYYVNNGNIRDFKGAKLDFSICYMIEITELKLEQEWTLNPDWIGLGNGLMELTKIGFEGGLTNTAESFWRDNGEDNNIEAQSYAQLLRYASRDEAMAEYNPIPSIGETEVNLKTQAPEQCYFRLDYEAELGYNWEHTTLLQNVKTDSLIFQELEFTQKVLIKFFTSEVMPLGPQGNDPLTVSRITTTTNGGDWDPSDLGLLRKIWDWIVTNLFGGRQWLAILVALLVAFGIPLIAGVIFLVVTFGPSVLLIPFKLIGKVRGG